MSAKIWAQYGCNIAWNLFHKIEAKIPQNIPKIVVPIICVTSCDFCIGSRAVIDYEMKCCNAITSYGIYGCVSIATRFCISSFIPGVTIARSNSC